MLCRKTTQTKYSDLTSDVPNRNLAEMFFLALR